MDLWEQPGGRPLPRRELQLQGPRPSPLNVRKDSHKIKKNPPPPPPAPPPSSEPTAPPPQRRSPVIIYTVSPKVIHTKPSEFMSLVQRLTGVSSSSAATTAEKADSAAEKTRTGAGPIAPLGEYEAKKAVSPRILSLLPPSNTLAGSPSLFSPSEAMSPLNFMNELSPGLQGSRAFVESNFLNSPGNLLSTSALASPTTFWDLLNQLKE